VSLPPPRIQVVDPAGERLVVDLPPVAAVVAAPRGLGTAWLLLGGLTILALGLPVTWAVGQVADSFARAPWLGWTVLSVVLVGFGVLLVALLREILALRAVEGVDRLRADLASGDASRVASAALDWAGRFPEGQALLPALRGVNDPDAMVALLRAGPAEALRTRALLVGRGAAMQAALAIAAVPSPALDVVFVAWRALRLVRQVAAVYGLRPGIAGTLALARRALLSAAATGGSEAAANAVAHAVLSNPLLAHVAGEAAGAAIAGRRMVVLARATAVACDPLP
jgi:putative membrane protein